MYLARERVALAAMFSEEEIRESAEDGSESAMCARAW